MSTIIGIGVVGILILGAVLMFMYRKNTLTGSEPASITALIAILFTSGLDGGFILLPLFEYNQYTTDEVYQFTNPLAIEMGFLGISAWAMYFVSTLYFLTLEPKLKFFEILWVKRLSACVVVATCAFTLSLFLDLMPYYLPDQLKQNTWLLGGLTTIIIVASLVISINTLLMTLVSKVSVITFLLLCCYLAWLIQLDFTDIAQSISYDSDYFNHAHRFILPFNDYHEFYLAWWMTWSIMLGQFVAKFVRNLKPVTLFFVMTILPLLPSFIWFSLLFQFFENGYVLSTASQLVMLILGCGFVINSIDFMVASYSQTFNLTLSKQGPVKFVIFNTGILVILTCLFQSQWVFVQTAASLVVLIIILLLAKQGLVLIKPLSGIGIKKARG